MTAEEASRIRESPAVEVLGTGGSINRVVDTVDYGRVIDRRGMTNVFSPRPSLPGIIPQPHFEHEILWRLNQADVSFAPKIYHASVASGGGEPWMIVEYFEGRTFGYGQISKDSDLRRWYVDRSLDVMNELASVSPQLAIRNRRPEERGLWTSPKGNFADVEDFGWLLGNRLKRFWNALMRGRESLLLGQFGSTESVLDRLRGIEITQKERRMTFLHNDLSPDNIVKMPYHENVRRQPFGVIDWTYASQGDLLWEAALVSQQLDNDPEKEDFLTALHQRLPPPFLKGFDVDWPKYQLMLREKIRALAAGAILTNIKAAFENDPQVQAARSEVFAPYAKAIHQWSADFAGHPPERTQEETLEVLVAYAGHVIDGKGAASSFPYARPRVIVDLALPPARHATGPSDLAADRYGRVIGPGEATRGHDAHREIGPGKDKGL